MDKEYTGPLAEHIRGLVAEKRATGYVYTTAATILKRFDILTEESFPDATTITQEVALAWASRLETECAASLLNRIAPIRDLAKRMQRMGIEAYVLRNDGFARPVRAVRHVFTKQELSLFFAAADSYSDCTRNPNRRLVAQHLFRTIYCCGLRPCEATRLKPGGVNLDEGTLEILKAKGDKDRLVYMSDELRLLLLAYDKAIAAAMPGRRAFFPNWEGHHISIKNIENWFNELWYSLPESICRTQKKPSIQSFLHTFACERIRLWTRAGKDLRSVIFYLSEYMGHESFRETEYYLHLLPEHFSDLLQSSAAISDALFPEVV
ncbi:MAG: tyrosine-type recombinase/integrase [Coriobacteriales bacterium]|jgi:integrase|nr:tyrosine-type recombinase/integrase [Coriobacteriales bacterium]